MRLAAYDPRSKKTLSGMAEEVVVGHPWYRQGLIFHLP